VITYHQIKGLIDKTAQQTSCVCELKEFLLRISELSEQITAISQDLEKDQADMSREIDSIKALEKILQREVFDKPLAGAQKPFSGQHESPCIRTM